jgi:surface antigen
MRVSLRRLAAAALVVPLCGPAAAFNEMFAKDAPITRMTKDDFAAAGKVLRKALDEGRDGEPQAWSNPGTKASGTVTPAAAFEKQGLRCRPTEFSITTRGETSRSKWVVCKTPQGWKVLEGG